MTATQTDAGAEAPPENLLPPDKAQSSAPASLTVHQAVNAVMAEVRPVGKDSEATAGGARYKFRGVDAVVNAVHAAIVKHGVIVAPIAAQLTHTNVTSKSGTAGRAADLTVTYRWWGPAGDYFDTQVCGESMDWGDKSTPKAFSVAYRTCLLQTLNLPTDDPDPDSEQFEHVHTPPTQARRERPQSVDRPADSSGGGQPTKLQRGRIFAELNGRGIRDENKQREWLSDRLDKPITSRGQLTFADAKRLIDWFEQNPHTSAGAEPVSERPVDGSPTQPGADDRKGAPASDRPAAVGPEAPADPESEDQ